MVLIEPEEPQIDLLPIQRMILQAQKWNQMLEDNFVTRADLGREYGCSRARVTQILSLLRLDNEVITLILSLDPLQIGERGITERSLRTLVEKTPKEQLNVVRSLIDSAMKGEGLRRQRFYQDTRSGRS